MFDNESLEWMLKTFMWLLWDLNKPLYPCTLKGAESFGLFSCVINGEEREQSHRAVYRWDVRPVCIGKSVYIFLYSLFSHSSCHSHVSMVTVVLLKSWGWWKHYMVMWWAASLYTLSFNVKLHEGTVKIKSFEMEVCRNISQMNAWKPEPENESPPCGHIWYYKYQFV